MPGFILFLVFGLALLWGAMTSWVAWMLTHPPRRTYASAVARGRPGDPSELPGSPPSASWMFRSRGLELPVWDITGGDPRGPVIVLSHGWADSRIGGLARAPALLPHASRLVLWDMAGHGTAPGVCQLGIGEAEDLAALLEQVGNAVPIVLYGWSLGAGVSMDVATRVAVAAVIAESPYRLAATPARNVLRARALPWRSTLRPALGALRWCFGDGLADRRFDRATLAARLNCPLLVVHGDQDVICPIADGRAIAGAARKAEIAVIEGGGHNDLWTNPAFAAACAGHISGFLAALSRPTLTP